MLWCVLSETGSNHLHVIAEEVSRVACRTNQVLGGTWTVSAFTRTRGRKHITAREVFSLEALREFAQDF
jgi:hypothetical protein